MKLYRVEHRESEQGPFFAMKCDKCPFRKTGKCVTRYNDISDDTYNNQMKCHFSFKCNEFDYVTSNGYPCPSRDAGIGRSILNSELVAVQSIYLLHHWFPNQMLKEFIFYGFNIVEIEIDDEFVLQGTYQSIYWKDKVKSKRVMDYAEVA